MVKMPIDQFRLISVRFLFHDVVQDKNRIIGLDVADMRLDDSPEIMIGQLLTTQEARDLIMTEVIDQSGKSRCGGLTKRSDQIVRVQVKELRIAGRHWGKTSVSRQHYVR